MYLFIEDMFNKASLSSANFPKIEENAENTPV